MLGNFQQSYLRIELAANADAIRENLLHSDLLKKWMWFQRFESELPKQLYPGLTFTSWAGLLAIENQVEIAEHNTLRLLLSQGIDGYHEWYWGDGWVQSKLEGISILPLNLAQTLGLLRLRQIVSQQSEN